MAPVRKYAITGGIGSGKSFICKIIEGKGIPVFYCDDVAKHIIRTDKQVQTALKNLVGTEVYDAGGKLCKPVLAAYLCQGETHAARINAIVHPRVAEAFKVWAKGQDTIIVVMECALLFESGFDTLVDETITVYTPEDLRIQRVMQRDNVTREKTLDWISLQMPEEEKAKRAHHIIYNDNTNSLEAQINAILNIKS